VSGAVVVALVLLVPAAAFTLWPLLRRRGATGALLPLPLDAREQLDEDKRAALRALRELDFEHDGGHVSDDDYAELRARYEAEAAETLRALDALGPAPASRATPPLAAPAVGRGWRHPAALAAGAVALVVFGVGLGVGIVRYTEPDQMAGAPAPGSRPLAALEPPPPGAPPSAANAPRGPVTPQMLSGMLDAARASLFAGRYGEAIAAYQAVLKRDPNNVDALTHMGLIAAIAARGEHGPEMIDRALGLFDRALALQPDYPPALLYRGQVLYEAKNDAAGAIRSWERFVKVAPAGDDRARVERMIAEAKARPRSQ
jgi:cytochrome c-type biogenesis protein CcmH/NrfG